MFKAICYDRKYCSKLSKNMKCVSNIEKYESSNVINYYLITDRISNFKTYISEYSSKCYYWTWNKSSKNCGLKDEHGLS